MLYLFTFHNTESFYVTPLLLLALSVKINNSKQLMSWWLFWRISWEGDQGISFQISVILHPFFSHFIFLLWNFYISLVLSTLLILHIYNIGFLWFFCSLLISQIFTWNLSFLYFRIRKPLFLNTKPKYRPRYSIEPDQTLTPYTKFRSSSLT
jgi:hypothetical protein